MKAKKLTDFMVINWFLVKLKKTENKLKKSDVFFGPVKIFVGTYNG